MKTTRNLTAEYLSKYWLTYSLKVRILGIIAVGGRSWMRKIKTNAIQILAKCSLLFERGKQLSLKRTYAIFIGLWMETTNHNENEYESKCCLIFSLPMLFCSFAYEYKRTMVLRWIAMLLGCMTLFMHVVNVVLHGFVCWCKFSMFDTITNTAQFLLYCNYSTPNNQKQIQIFKVFQRTNWRSSSQFGNNWNNVLFVWPKVNFTWDLWFKSGLTQST